MKWLAHPLARATAFKVLALLVFVATAGPAVAAQSPYVTPSVVEPGDTVVLFTAPIAPTDQAFLIAQPGSDQPPLADPPGPGYVEMVRTFTPPLGHATCASPLACFVVPAVPAGLYRLVVGHPLSWHVALLDLYGCIDLHRLNPKASCDVLQIGLPPTDAANLAPPDEAPPMPWTLVAGTALLALAVLIAFDRDATRRRRSA